MSDSHSVEEPEYDEGSRLFQAYIELNITKFREEPNGSSLARKVLADSEGKIPYVNPRKQAEYEAADKYLSGIGKDDEIDSEVESVLGDFGL